MTPLVSVVVPTVGRPSLDALLRSLLVSFGDERPDVVLVDDRPGRVAPLEPGPAARAARARVVRSGGVGPAGARNAGWRATCTEWVAFLDDDVVVTRDWYRHLVAELEGAAPDVGGVQGRIRVPLPGAGPATDWERQTAGLARSAWITADMAYRRRALVSAEGFDERFPRAYREDSELALRVRSLGWRLVRGTRAAQHPVRPVPWWQSLRSQAGNADDVLVRRLHGPGWRGRIAAPPGLRPVHVLVTALGTASLGLALARRPAAATAAATGWAAGVGWLTGYRTTDRPDGVPEVARMVATSLALSPLAVWHYGSGLVRHRHVSRWAPPAAVLFDRDGTLVHDVPFNGDPASVRPVEGAVDVVRGLRARGVRVGVVSNQSGIGRGLLREDQVRAVNDAVDRALGPFDVWEYCPHAPDEGCTCRKPAPGLVVSAARRLGVPPSRVGVVGDVAADLEAARRAGARAVLVPTPQTRAEEVRAAPLVAGSLREAVEMLVGALP